MKLYQRLQILALKLGQSTMRRHDYNLKQENIYNKEMLLVWYFISRKINHDNTLIKLSKIIQHRLTTTDQDPPSGDFSDALLEMIGGGMVHFSSKQLEPFVVNEKKFINSTDIKYRFKELVPAIDAKQKDHYLQCQIPVDDNIVSQINVKELKILCLHHHIFHSRISKNAMVKSLKEHYCTNCTDVSFCFEPLKILSNKACVKKYEQSKTIDYRREKEASRSEPKIDKVERKQQEYLKRKEDKIFPPLPPKQSLIDEIITGFCEDTDPTNQQEAGCCVCGILWKTQHLLQVKDLNIDFSILANENAIRKERKSKEESPFYPKEEPVLTCSDKMCITCHNHLKTGCVPPEALAKGMWIGKIPNELRNLTWCEKLLISKVRHSRAVVKVSSGRMKMKANVICFANPISKVYNILPPPRHDLKEMLAFVFTGPCQPTNEDLRRTPLLVRRANVKDALDWLKLNHIDYYDIDISDENLEEYEENGVPVGYDYEQTETNSDPLTSAVNDDVDEEEGTESGPCPFRVHGLTSDKFADYSPKQVRAEALAHLKKQHKSLYIGQKENPEETFKNPQLYAQMFPHLFPYGLGSVGNTLYRSIANFQYGTSSEK